MPKKNITYIDGVGWRCPVDSSRHHRSKRIDYYDRGIYHITVAVNGRHPLFGHICGSCSQPKDSPDAPHLEPTEMGLFVEKMIAEMPAHCASKGLQMKVVKHQVMEVIKSFR